MPTTARSLLRSPGFWGVVGAIALGAGAVAYGRRQVLRGAFGRTTAGPAPVVVHNRAGRPPVASRVKVGDMTLTRYAAKSLPIGQRVRLIQDQVWNGVNDPRIRELALKITRGCGRDEGPCEVKSVFDAVHKNVRYTGDVGPVLNPKTGEVEPHDYYQSPWRTWSMHGGDCLPSGTLLLTDRMEFVPIEKLVIGQKIWGREDWTEVKDVWSKGILSVDDILLNNGSSFKATPDHKVYVALCPRHVNRSEGARLCACSIEERSIERLTVAQLEPGMVLVQPERIAFGTEQQDPRRALVEGLYLADGWMSHACDFEISGQDGCPKEAQKREVQEICEALGIETRWHRKYLAIKDRAWAERIAQMGGRAPEKHALSINLVEDAARALLRGILADAGKNTNGGGSTFTTTSRELLLQTRVLLRMQGVSCSERYIVDHGGLGTNPIWRLGVRDMNRSDGRAVKFLRVKAIDRDVMSLPTYDIQTADHYVYLPEADVVVSNCDDHVALVTVLLASIGHTMRLRVSAPSKWSDWAHIYPVVGTPKVDPSKWIAVDTTLEGRPTVGSEARYGKARDYVNEFPA